MVNEILKTDIPDDWDIKKLEPNVGFVRSGKRLPKGYYVTPIPTQHPYIRVADMRPGYVDVEGLMYVPDEAYFWIQKYRIYRDDIYISVAGTLGIVGQIPGYLDGANLTENANRITDIKCNIKFLMYWLMSSKIQGLINQTQTLGAQPKLALTRIRNFPIILPPIEEQEQIAEVLCNVDSLITNLRKLIRKKKNIRQGTMQMLVTGKKRLDGFSGEWEIVEIGSVAKVIDPHPSHRAPGAVQYGIPFVGIGDIDEEGNINRKSARMVDERVYVEHSQRYDLSKNLIGIGRVASLGKVIRLRNDVGEYAISPTMAVIDFESIDPMFAYYYMQSSEFQDQFTSSSNGSTRQSVGMHYIRKLNIRKPLPEEQIALSRCLEDMDYEIRKLEEKLSKYQEVKQGMVEELLTGKVRLV